MQFVKEMIFAPFFSACAHRVYFSQLRRFFKIFYGGFTFPIYPRRDFLGAGNMA